MEECLAPEAPVSAAPYVETPIEILERIGARNDLARHGDGRCIAAGRR